MTDPLPVIIFGAGGHALVVADILELTGHRIVGFIDEVSAERRGAPIAHGMVVGGVGDLPRLAARGYRQAIIAVGNCRARVRIAKMLVKDGFSLINAIHPSAVVARSAQLGTGCVAAANATISPGVSIGDNVIVNTGAIVDHDCVVESGAHLCPGVRLAGRVRIGASTWIGIGTTIIDRVNVGDGAYIGAGSLVLRDIPDGMLAYGVPARIVRRADG